MHLLTYTWLMTKHYNTQNDSAFLSAFFFYGISPIQRPHYITSSYTYQFLKKVIFCSSLQYRSALVVVRMRNIVLLTYAWLMAKRYNTQNDSASLPVRRR